MTTGSRSILPPTAPADVNGAYRVIDDFHQHYNEDLITAQNYLDRLVATTPAQFAEGYMPWLKALRDFVQGVHLLAKKIPLPDPKRFKEAVTIFSLDSTINFIFDLCAAARRTMEIDWAEKFRKDIVAVLAAFQIIAQQKQAQTLSHAF